MFVAVWTILLLIAGADSVYDRRFALSEGGCPVVNGKQHFKYRRFLGTWYEYKRFPVAFEDGQQCSKHVYEAHGYGVRLTIEGWLRINLFGESSVVSRETVVRNATIPKANRPSELSLSMGLYNLSHADANFFILDTNYTDWAVVFACHSMGGYNIQFAWMLTRPRGVPPTNLPQIEKALTEAGINVLEFDLVNQWNCPTFTN
ncbi:apolipoprotein d [Plakobranchus ocellatus]|uniref:Apolipoprotein d n=1 Tax=Plakobranchus ocellatus TaxID=259542 RepID=A0AAV4CA76_9GAST|nr:apolipoprotein d [Plakobranchus ocellatus]